MSGTIIGLRLMVNALNTLLIASRIYRSLVRDESGNELKFVPDKSQNWSIGNNEKTSIGYVDVPTATTLQLDVDDVGRERIVTVSKRTMKQELWARLGGFGIGIIVGLIGVSMTVIGSLLRRRTPNVAVTGNRDR